MDGGDEKGDSGREQHEPLQDAQGTGFEPVRVLEVVAECEHACAGEEPGEIADSSGKKQLEHELRA
jgi:hypothetical protein